MCDDRKHTEPVKSWFTEREFCDISRLALQEDRKVSELVRVIVRRHLYGNVGATADDMNGATSATSGRAE